MTLLRLWLVATAVVLVAMAVWAFAPVLLFVALLTAALGFLAAAMIDLAHRLPGWLAWLRGLLRALFGRVFGWLRRQ